MRTAISLAILVVVFPGAWAAIAQPGDAVDVTRFPWEGEIGGNNVYVRSGAGVNWYPTTKLNVGDRVLVLGEKYGWYEIMPPVDSFSYIDQAMVDRAGRGKTGTVRQDRVYVRAGSHLESRKTATQCVVSKGQTVQILGEAEGFYKIAPPREATLYVSKQYVKPVPPRMRTGLLERYSNVRTPPSQMPAEQAPAQTTTAGPAVQPLTVGGSAARPSTAGPAAIQPSMTGGTAVQPRLGSPPMETTVGDDATPPSGAMAGEPLHGQEEPPMEVIPSIDELKAGDTGGTARTATPQTAEEPMGSGGTDPGSPAAAGNRYDVLLTQVENLLHAELRRPLKEQDLDSIIKRYEEIAAQKDEYVPAQIAAIRIRQLNNRKELIAARGEDAASAEELEAFRARLQADRMSLMRRGAEAIVDDFDLEGELRRSHVFSPTQRRYRLVNPDTGTTIAYVDIPPTLDVNADFLIGRRVGIHTSSKQFSPSARVPVAVAARITDLTGRQLAPVSPQGVPPVPVDVNKAAAIPSSPEPSPPAARQDSEKPGEVVTAGSEIEQGD